VTNSYDFWEYKQHIIYVKFAPLICASILGQQFYLGIALMTNG